MSATGVLCHSRPRRLRGGASSQELQKERAQVIHTLGRVDVWLSPLREELAVHIQQLCPTSLSLPPPHLMEALSVLEPLSHWTGYLLESTDTIIPTLPMILISSPFPHQALKI